EPTAIVADRPRGSGRQIRNRRRFATRNRTGSQTTAGNQVLPRRPAFTRIARARPAHTNQRSHSQRPAQDGWRAAESEREDWHPLIALYGRRHQVQETSCETRSETRNRSPTE